MKEYRKEELKYYVIGNILIILLLSDVVKKLWGYSQGIPENIIENIAKLLGVSLLSSIIYIYVFILDSIVPSKLKQFIIFFPFGEPGKTIFQKIRKKNIDSRFTQEDTVVKYSSIYTEQDSIKDKKKQEEYQNSKWYSIYQSIEDNPTVVQSQKDFLLNRDMCIITIVIGVIYVIISKVSGLYEIRKIVIYWLGGELIVTYVAAKSKAKRFVLNVIAKDIHR